MLAILQEYFGYKALREGQLPVMEAIVSGKSALAVFPTGGGKSLCYQIPALLFDGLTVVISPLIALMKDQVDALVAKGISAARLDSTLDGPEADVIYSRLLASDLKLLYISPERFANPLFRKKLKGLNISLLAVDEAHCISEWGHNFRPDYLMLPVLAKKWKVQRILALTATATPKVAKDIRQKFRINSANHFQRSFHRENLDLKITVCEENKRKEMLLHSISFLKGSIIVYVTRQETAEEVSTYLIKQGYISRAYHAGLPTEVRTDVQTAFMGDVTQIVVATMAFGMGIDKANIRSVIHYNLPKSLENYGQEIGRAGRDSMPAVCEMLACREDITVLENYIHASSVSAKTLENLLQHILNRGKNFSLSHYDLTITCDVSYAVITTVLKYLEIRGLLQETGKSFYTFRARLLRSQERILAGRSSKEVKFLKSLLAEGEMKFWWLTWDAAVTAHKLGVKHERIVETFRELERAEDIILKVSGVHMNYTLKKCLSDTRPIIDELIELFANRTIADFESLQKVIQFPSQKHCLTNYLNIHFGEKVYNRCGHCDRCRDLPAQPLTRPGPREITDEVFLRIRTLVLAKHSQLGTPTALAKFLCGMRTPAVTRGRLTILPEFALLLGYPYDDVLAVASAVLGIQIGTNYK